MFVCFTFVSSLINLIYSGQLQLNYNSKVIIQLTVSEYNGKEATIKRALDGSMYPG